MRVLFFSAGFWPDYGGVETLAGQLLPELSGAGLRFLVLAPLTSRAPHEQACVQGVEVRRLPLLDDELYRDPEQLLRTRHSLQKLLREFDPQVLHVNGLGRSALLLSLGGAGHPVPTLVSVHGAWSWTGQDNSVVRRVFERAHWVTACSQQNLQACRSLLPRLESRSSLLYNALPPQPAPVWPGDPQRRPVVLCAGRFRPEKGLDRALRAWSQVKAARPEAELWLVGQGPEEPRLRAMARSQSGVRFLGWRQPQEVQQLLRQCSLVLVPSRQEGFGMVALEGLWSGTPVVASAVGGLPEVLDHGRAGRLVFDRDWASPILDILSDAASAKALAERGYAHARRSFSWSDYRDRHLQLYRHLGGRS